MNPPETLEMIEDFEVLDLLTSLVDKSLVVYEEATGRYHLLETVRQYGHDRLGESGEMAVGSRAASWFLGLAEEAEALLTGPEQAAWLSRLETEHDNLRASLAWYENKQDHKHEPSSEEVAGGLRLAGALWRFWEVHGHYSEGRQWLGRALARSQSGAAPGAAIGADGGAMVSTARAKALNGAGLLAYYQSDFTTARALLEQSLTIRRGLGDQKGISNSLNNLGNVAYDQGDYAGARALHQQSLTMRRQLGDQGGVATSLNNLGNVACWQSDYTGARALYEESLTMRRQVGDQKGVADSLNNLGNVACWQSDYTGARALLEESLTLYRQLGDQGGIAEALGGLSDLAQGQSQSSRAARLGGAASCLRERIGSPLSPAEQEKRDKSLASAREALGEEAFGTAWEEGQTMTLEQAVEYALAE